MIEFYLACKSPINGYIEQLSVIEYNEHLTISIIYRPVDIKNDEIIYSDKIAETKKVDMYEMNDIKAQFNKQQSLRANSNEEI